MFLSHHQVGIDSVKSGNDTSFMCFSPEFGVRVVAHGVAPGARGLSRVCSLQGEQLKHPFSLLFCPTGFPRVKIHGESTNIWINKGCRGVICICALKPLLEEEPGKHTMYDIGVVWKARECL